MYVTATDEEDWTNSYPISEKYRHNLDGIVSRWHVTPLYTFDVSGEYISIPKQESALRGSMALIYFQLKHYAIKDK
jgi:hypothetical protein